MNSCLPSHYLNRMSARNRDIWKHVDFLRANGKSGLPEWDRHVFLPLDGWIKLLGGIYPDHDPDEFQSMVLDFSTAGAWRPGQDIVRFDPDLQAMLMQTAPSDNIPVHALRHLPAWCIYFETGKMEVNGHSVEGFFASLEQNVGRDCFFLRLLFLAPNGSLPVLVPLLNCPLEKAVAMANELTIKTRTKKGLCTNKKHLPYVDDGLRNALNMATYLCSESMADKNHIFASLPQPKKIRHGGWRLFPPAAPRVHLVGKNLGDAFRHAINEADNHNRRATPAPHLRRAHWHGYWNGPKNGNREFVLKWLPPIPVGMKKEVMRNSDFQAT